MQQMQENMLRFLRGNGRPPEVVQEENSAHDGMMDMDNMDMMDNMGEVMGYGMFDGVEEAQEEDMEEEEFVEIEEDEDELDEFEKFLQLLSEAQRKVADNQVHGVLKIIGNEVVMMKNYSQSNLKTNEEYDRMIIPRGMMACDAEAGDTCTISNAGNALFLRCFRMLVGILRYPKGYLKYRDYSFLSFLQFLF